MTAFTEESTRWAEIDFMRISNTELKTLDQARGECKRVIGDMALVFGERHFILLNLHTTWGDLLDELGELSNQKCCERESEQIGKTNGIDHLYYIRSISNVVQSHAKLGEWVKTRLLQEEVLNSIEGAHSRLVGSIKNNLALAYQN